MPWLGSLLTAVDTNTRSPQTIGLETATPATGVFQATFSPVAALHFTAVALPSATPEALTPRKDGQFCAPRVAPAIAQVTSVRIVRLRCIIIFLPRACRRRGCPAAERC